tara:strand:- start:202 stop:339 length:138 start_codon:yes stop_codon:yes gene_type:complete
MSSLDRNASIPLFVVAPVLEEEEAEAEAEAEEAEEAAKEEEWLVF